MRKTTVLIDEKLLANAIQAIGAHTKKEAIETGLKYLVKNRNQNLLRKELGTYDIDLSLEGLKDLRSAE
jgi:Arc/MetJ family transcription regulator